MAEVIPQYPRLHPPDRHKIIEAFEEAVADPVLGNAVGPRKVTHRNFGDRKAVHPGQGGKEAVHPFEELKPFDYSPPEDLERAPRVMNLVADHGMTKEVGDAG